MAKPRQLIGFIGLGNAGYHLASLLARANYNLIVNDANKSAIDHFISSHPNAQRTDTNFSKVDILILMLPNGNIVQQVLRDTAPSLKDNAIIIDMSSSSPFQTRETGKLLSAINSTLTLVDSPVTQEYAFALAKGDATLMIGCSNASALERVMPLLKILGKYIFVMGGLGSGHAMKTLNNYVSAASILGLCDALIAGQKFGLEPEKMVDVMNVGTGNFSTKESFRTDGLTRRFQSGYQLSLLLKDMRIAREVLRATEISSSLSDLIVDALAEADRVAGPGADHTQVIHAWEKQAGVQLKRSELKAKL